MHGPEDKSRIRWINNDHKNAFKARFSETLADEKHVALPDEKRIKQE